MLIKAFVLILAIFVPADNNKTAEVIKVAPFPTVEACEVARAKVLAEAEAEKDDKSVFGYQVKCVDMSFNPMGGTDASLTPTAN